MIEGPITVEMLLKKLDPSFEPDKLEDKLEALYEGSDDARLDVLVPDQMRHPAQNLEDLKNIYLFLGGLICLTTAPALTPALVISIIGQMAGLSALSPKKVWDWFGEKFKVKQKDLVDQAVKREEEFCYAMAMVNLTALAQSFRESTAPEMLQKLQTSYSCDRGPHVSLLDLVLYDPSSVSHTVLDRFFLSFELSDKQTGTLLNYSIAGDESYFFAYRNALLLHLATKSPRFAVQLNFNYLEAQTKQLESLAGKSKKILELLEKVSAWQKGQGSLSFFTEQAVHSGWDSRLDRKLSDLITTHQNNLAGWAERKMLDTDEDLGVDLPKAGDIFINQACGQIRYDKEKHEQEFLKDEFWLSGKKQENGPVQSENVLAVVEQLLCDPIASEKPIIILGHPGSGKSFLSECLAAQLSQSGEFLPIHIRLREIADETAEISNHLNAGLKLINQESGEFDWTDLKAQVPGQVLTFILDGFDELLRSSRQELNAYLSKLRECLKKARRDGYLLRFVVTSRSNLMQSVDIPTGTPILHLLPFDETRQKRWVKAWNKAQKGVSKEAKFYIPKRAEVAEMAREPILLFLLALHHGKHNGLAEFEGKESFDSSMLYDRLIARFIERQMQKHPPFQKRDLSVLQRDEKFKDSCRKFRFQVGLVAFHMFFEDEVFVRQEQYDALEKAFAITPAPGIGLFTEFLFLFSNRAKEADGKERRAFEFLHKTVGEFLAADFLLDIAFGYAQEDHVVLKAAEIEAMQMAFGYQWIAAHPKIFNFFFEWGRRQRDAGRFDERDIIRITKFCTSELEKILSNHKTAPPFPIQQFRDMPNHNEMEHWAIYSQNLVLLMRLFHDEALPFPLPKVGAFWDRFDQWTWLLQFWSLHHSKVLGQLATRFAVFYSLDKAKDATTLYLEEGDWLREDDRHRIPPTLEPGSSIEFGQVCFVSVHYLKRFLEHGHSDVEWMRLRADTPDDLIEALEFFWRVGKSVSTYREAKFIESIMTNVPAKAWLNSGRELLEGLRNQGDLAIIPLAYLIGKLSFRSAEEKKLALWLLEGVLNHTHPEKLFPVPTLRFLLCGIGQLISDGLIDQKQVEPFLIEAIKKQGFQISPTGFSRFAAQTLEQVIRFAQDNHWEELLRKTARALPNLDPNMWHSEPDIARFAQLFNRVIADYGTR